MSLSAIKITHGLTATFTAEAPAVTWTEKIGSAPENVTLTGTHGYEITATLGASTNHLDLDLTQGLATITGSGASASGTLTGNAVADETVTIGTKTYTWKASVSTTANEVKIGVSASASLDNLIAAINAGSGSGTVYGSSTTAHGSVNALGGAGDTMIVGAVSIGTGGNAIATTETMTNGSWGAATLAGGINASSFVGGDGKDNEGTDIPTEGDIDAIRIRCTAGTLVITAGTALSLPLGTGGVFLLGIPGTPSGLLAEDLNIEATSADTTFTVEVISHIPD